MAASAPTLPARELDDYDQFGARIGASRRTVTRLVENGLPVIKLGRLVRIDPAVGMAFIRGELPPPELPRPGRSRKRDNTSTVRLQRAQAPQSGPNLGLSTAPGEPCRPDVAMPGGILLRPDQEQDIALVREALRRDRRVVLQRPTGTGKTVIFCGITRQVAGAAEVRTLILQHREELIAQTSRTLAEMQVDHGIIAAGHPHHDAPVQVGSIDTVTRRLGAYQPDAFKLLFVDEAHHAAAPSWQRVINHFASAYVIGCTATPERLDGKGLDHLFGELVSSRTVQDYVKLGVLAPAVTFAPPEAPDLSGIRRRLGDYEQEALADRMSDSAIVGDAVEHYKRLSPQLGGIVFCCSRAHSKLVAGAFTAAGYAARHVDGETRAAEREATICAPANSISSPMSVCSPRGSTRRYWALSWSCARPSH